jgi:hypothetical protein
MTEFSKEQKQKIVQKLVEKGATLPCPRCGRNHFTLIDGYLAHPLQDELGGLVLGGPTLPSIVVICTNCGFMSQHALGVLGLLPEEKKS